MGRQSSRLRPESRREGRAASEQNVETAGELCRQTTRASPTGEAWLEQLLGAGSDTRGAGWGR